MWGGVEGLRRMIGYVGNTAKFGWSSWIVSAGELDVWRGGLQIESAVHLLCNLCCWQKVGRPALAMLLRMVDIQILLLDHSF